MTDTTEAPQAGAVEAETTDTTAAPEATAPVSEAPATTALEAEVDPQDDDPLAVALGKLEKAVKEAKSLRGAKNDRDARIAELEAQLAEATTKAIASEQAEARAAAFKAQLRDERLNAALARQTAALRIADNALVARLLDKSAVSWDDAGQPSNLEALLTELVTAHPVLVATPAPIPTGAVTAPSRTTTPSSIDDLEGLKGPELLSALKKMTARK